MHDDSATQPKPGNGLAITALVLGIIGLLIPLLGIAALVLGILGLKNQARGLAIAGIVLGSLGILTSCVACSTAVALPSLLESKVIAQEHTAVATLKAGVFPHQVQFQALATVDQNRNDRGEYAVLSELASSGFTPGQRMAGKEGWQGYSYVIYLPADSASALTIRQDPPSAEATKLQEKHFVCYAWPVDAKQGRKLFAITERGIVYQHEIEPGSKPGAPAWNALFDGGDWASQPSWSEHPR